jgi:hypothetical protein
MRIGAKNSTPVTDRKHFLVQLDAGKGFISSVCATLARAVASRSTDRRERVTCEKS